MADIRQRHVVCWNDFTRRQWL